MDRSCVIYLVSEDKTTSKDEYGDDVIVRPRTKRYAQVQSISQKEFYQAQTLGQKPEIKFTLALKSEYNGEDFVEYEGMLYCILRTYVTRTDKIELTCYGGVRLENVST